MRRFPILLAIALATSLGSGTRAQIVRPISPYPQCVPSKTVQTPCVCGLTPSTTCPAGNWCSFSPEGAPHCSQRKPLHR